MVEEIVRTREEGARILESSLLKHATELSATQSTLSSLVSAKDAELEETKQSHLNEHSVLRKMLEKQLEDAVLNAEANLAESERAHVATKQAKDEEIEATKQAHLGEVAGLREEKDSAFEKLRQKTSEDHEETRLTLNE
jgi:hypothetical protein